MTNDKNDGAWFVAKRYGYGAGLPTAWRGWALLLGYTAAIFGLSWLVAAAALGTKVVAVVLFAFGTLLVLETARRHTAGGWKWRWGSRD